LLDLNHNLNHRFKSINPDPHTASLSLISHYTRQSETHTQGTSIIKRCVVVESLALKQNEYTVDTFQKRSTENIFDQMTFKNRPKNAKRPNQNPTANQLQIRPRLNLNLAAKRTIWQPCCEADTSNFVTHGYTPVTHGSDRCNSVNLSPFNCKNFTSCSWTKNCL